MKLSDLLDKQLTKEANSYSNALNSMAEGIYIPIGVRAGAEWALDKLTPVVAQAYSNFVKEAEEGEACDWETFLKQYIYED